MAGSKLLNLQGDQFPILLSVEVLDGHMPVAASPIPLTTDMTDAHFIPNFPTSLAQMPMANAQSIDHQGVKLYFVED